MSRRRFNYILKLVALFVIYYATARFGLGLSTVDKFAAPVWPPSGIALAAIFILGYRYWPAIALGAMLVNINTGASILASIGIGVGNTLEPLVGVYLLKNFMDFQIDLKRVRDIIGLILFAALLSTTLSATIGTASLLLGGQIHWSDYGATWITWWMGDLLGDLIIASLIFVWYASRPRFALPPVKRIIEGAVIITLLVGVTTYVFRGMPVEGSGNFRFGYMIFPVLIGIALRFDQLGSVTATFLMSILATWFTIEGFGPFASDELNGSLAHLQSFVGVTSVTFMIMAAIVSEQISIQKRQAELIQEAKLMAREHSRLRALSKAQDEFTSLASHQLRTPATAVKQYIALLLENYVGKLTRIQRSMLQRAYESNERQLKVLDDLLKVARVDLGNVRLNKEWVNLVDLIRDVVELNKATFKSHSQSMNFIHEDEEFPVYIDKVKFGMALENLIDNASKYSSDNKKMEIRLGKQGKKPTILVIDQGVGIAKKDFSKLFKKFSRIENPLSITVGGTGLGLYWARKIIRLHGGSITVSSRVGRGSSFKITLPHS